MNIFEFLGLPSNLRPKNKVVQLVKHWREVPESRKQFPYFGQVKKDGVFAALVVNQGVAKIFGRTGSALTSCDYYLTSYECNTYPNGVYIGELLSKFPCSLEELSGVVNPERVNHLDEKGGEIARGIYIAFHDWIPLCCLADGISHRSYEGRHWELSHYLENTPAHSDILPYSVIHNEESRLEFASSCIDAGEEGAVFKRPDMSWVAGHKGFHQMKEVSQVSYDLLCVGYEEGEGKYSSKVANLIFQWRDGQTIKAMLGKGWTHDDASLMYRCLTTNWVTSSHYPLGKIFKVKGLSDSSKGKIRLPKVAEQRIDKTEGDY